jgi:pyruvate dehydrogenase E1 component beta subunit
VPFGAAHTVRPGKDLTVVTYSRMVHVAVEAAQQLSSEGIEAEVIDLRTLNPLDMDTVLSSVRRTRRALVLNEAHRTAGFCSELAARISEELFDLLEAPVARVAAKDVPVPATLLEKLSIPGAEDVCAEARTLVQRRRK